MSSLCRASGSTLQNECGGAIFFALSVSYSPYPCIQDQEGCSNGSSHYGTQSNFGSSRKPYCLEQPPASRGVSFAVVNAFGLLHSPTSQATAEVKGDAKAVAARISEGWRRDKPLDWNTATREQLLSLPGVTAAGADVPHIEPGELMTWSIIPKTEYDNIADRVTAKK